MTIDDLSSVFSLFVEGMQIGGLLSTIPFMIGCLIRGIVRLIKNA